MKSFAAFAMISGLASAHSWVHCTDYRGDTVHYEPDQCFGNPRPIDGKVPGMTPFGTDTGFNQQPGATKCHSTDAQHPSYPMATYQRGQQITLAWPTKNHVAATCTNAFIPDHSLRLYVAEGQFESTAEESFTWKHVPSSFSENPHVFGQMDQLGFQNCPDFCNNMDKTLCTGTFLVPEDLLDGTYTFQWRWEFNEGTSPYVTCFEANVAGDFDGTIIIPTRQPTDVNAPVADPTTAPENCGDEWTQCGGSAQSYSCCKTGLSCFKKDDWYSQCRVSCPTDDHAWECAQGTGPAPVADPTEPPVTPPTTEPPVTAPTEQPIESCVSTRVQFNGSPKKLGADDATHCWDKCQKNKTKNNEQCLGWEWVEGETKPCRLYTSATTSVAGLRECHPTQVSER
jgi:hypothetical protein